MWHLSRSLTGAFRYLMYLQMQTHSIHKHVKNPISYPKKSSWLQSRWGDDMLDFNSEMFDSPFPTVWSFILAM